MIVLNVVDVFAGCGGLSYGFRKAGFKIILGIDNDKDSAETFLKNHPGAKYLIKDVNKITKNDITEAVGNREVDLVIGGPPCQGFSVSGKRVFLDPRNSLYMQFFRILDMLNPKAAVVENVPGLKHMYQGKALESIVQEFEKRGYTVSYKILKAAEFGVPQIRRRIIIVGTKGKKFEFPDPSGKIVTLWDAISDLPFLDGEIESTEYAANPQNEYQMIMRKNSRVLHNHAGTKHSTRTIETIRLVPEGKNYKSLPEHLQNTRKVHIAWTRLDSSKPSVTIDTGHRHYFHPKADRVPTVRECARIQSFPDMFVFYGSKTSQYRQVGNAVPPLLAYAVAKKLKEAVCK